MGSRSPLVASRPGRIAVVALLTGTLYVLCARLSVLWFDDLNEIQPLWIATAACVGAALLIDPRDGPAVVAGVAIGELINATAFFDEDLLDVVGAMLANAVEAALAIALLRRLLGRRNGVRRVRQSLRWITIAVVTGAAGAAVAAVLVLPSTGRWEAAGRWWVGDSVALLLITPLGVIPRHPLLRPLTRAAIAELAGLALWLVACTAVAFATDTPLMYLTIPVIAWLGLRFGLRASAVAAAGVALWATISTADRHGPFVVGERDPVLQVQAYNVAVGLTSLIIAALATRATREHRDLLETHRQRIALEHELAAVRQAERDRIAQRLHDEAIQVLVAADLQLAAARRSGSPDQLGIVSDRIHLAIDELRNSISELSPPDMTGDHLAAGLHAIVARYQQPDGIRFEIDVASPPVDNATGTALYQIAREAVANAVVHGDPGLVRVSVQVQDVDGQSITMLHVEDDGIGVAPHLPTTHSASGHLGLRLMQERAASVGGTVTITPTDPHGTRVTARVPRRVA